MHFAILAYGSRVDVQSYLALGSGLAAAIHHGGMGATPVA
jgi:hypothetical protein